MENFVSDVNNWILSYPRSGNHLVRYMIEFMTKQTTLGCRDNEHIDTPIRDRSGVRHLHDVSNTPIARKAHTAVEIDVMNARSIILILRNPVDTMISHHGSDNKSIQEIEVESKEFVKNLLMYEKFQERKAIIKYEDLVSDNDYEKPISLIGSIFDVDNATLDCTLSNYSDLRADSLGGPIRTPQTIDKEGKVVFSRSQLLKSRNPASYEKIVDALKEVLEHDIMKLYYGSLVNGGSGE